MAASTRLLTALAILSAATAATGLAWPTWADDLLLGLPPGGGMAVQTAPSGREHQALITRVEAKSRVVRRLLDGELTLLQAAAWFGQLNGTPDDLPARGVSLVEGGCANEKLCRQVLLWAETELSATARYGEECRRVAQWETELADHIARHGRVVLPPR